MKARIAECGSAGPDGGEALPIRVAASLELPDIKPVAPEVGQKGLDPSAGFGTGPSNGGSC